MTESIKSKIRMVPHWPKEGIMFRDITTLLKEPDGINKTIDELLGFTEGIKIDKIVGIESRGFIFGSLLDQRLGVGFIPARKPGKLPAEMESQTYQLEYGEDSIEIHKDAITKGQKVLLIDDLIATGGTALASCNLIEKLEGEIVECCFTIELPDLKGKEKLSKYPVYSMIKFGGE